MKIRVEILLNVISRGLFLLDHMSTIIAVVLAITTDNMHHNMKFTTGAFILKICMFETAS